jgi:hypothetical protein
MSSSWRKLAGRGDIRAAKKLSNKLLRNMWHGIADDRSSICSALSNTNQIMTIKPRVGRMQRECAGGYQRMVVGVTPSPFRIESE